MRHQNTIYKKRIPLGKVDGYGIGKQSCAAEITVTIRKEMHCKRTIYHTPVDEYFTLSIVGSIWNHMHTDWISGGQNYDHLLSLRRGSHKLRRIVDVWKRWHLNDLKAGCSHQQTGKYSDAGISSQVCPVTGYKYGRAWLVELLPQSIIEEVKSW